MSATEFNVIFVLGKPGSGKGTQCDKLIKAFSSCKHLSAGDLLREERKNGGATGELIESFIQEGKIVPVEITIDLLQKAMKQLQTNVANNGDTKKLLFLIDGFPRNQDNLDGWEKQMTVSNVATVQQVLFFNISDEVATQRCLDRGAGGSGRTDDNLESIKKRLNTYKDTETIIEHYRKKNLVTELPGEATVDEVFASVEDVVKKILATSS